jgi:phage tail sheath protein FI
MPIQPTYPGVYIQEVSSGVRTITGVSTSIGAFFGRSLKGPINTAVRCLSYSDFLREFGGPHPLSDLGASVNQFFINGGTDCYVVRLASGAAPASVALKNGSGASAKEVLRATAKAPGAWGDEVKLVVDYNTTRPDDTFNLRVTQENGGAVLKSELHSNLSMDPGSARFAPTFVSGSSKLIELTPIGTTPGALPGFSQSGRVFTGTAPNPNDAVAAAMKTFIDSVTKTPATFANRQSVFNINVDGKTDVEVDLWGIGLGTGSEADVTAAIKTAIDTALTPHGPERVTVSFDTFTFAQTLPGPGTTVTCGMLRIATAASSPGVKITRAASNDFAGPMMLGVDQGGIEVGNSSNRRPAPNGTVFSGKGTGLTNILDNANGLGSFAGLAQGILTALVFDGPVSISVSVVPQLKTTPVDPAKTFPNFMDATGGNDGIREKLRLIRDIVNQDVNAPCTAELWGYRLAFKSKDGALNKITTVSTTGDAAFGGGFTQNTQRYSLGTLGTSAFQTTGVPGTDGNAPGQAEYQGNPITHTGFYALDTVDLFNLMVLPGDREVDLLTVKGAASTYCESRRAFLLLDSPADWTDVDHPVADASDVNNFRIGVAKKNAAVFYPRVLYSDAGSLKYIGPSGMIAGLMARTDSQRGVWKAPAGVEADLRGVADVEINMTDLENGVLNKLGVNGIRKFPNGIVNWGARTLDGNDDFGSEWKYIPIRRLALFLEESLFRGTKWVVFEPNDEPLWANIRMNLNAFMLGLFRQGAFQGSTPDKAFFVKCDGETTTANDRNLGIVNIVVGFAPLKPAEFVIITIQQIPDV